MESFPRGQPEGQDHHSLIYSFPGLSPPPIRSLALPGVMLLSKHYISMIILNLVMLVATLSRALFKLHASFVQKILVEARTKFSVLHLLPQKQSSN